MPATHNIFIILFNILITHNHKLKTASEKRQHYYSVILVHCLYSCSWFLVFTFICWSFVFKVFYPSFFIFVVDPWSVHLLLIGLHSRWSLQLFIHPWSLQLKTVILIDYLIAVCIPLLLLFWINDMWSNPYNLTAPTCSFERTIMLVYIYSSVIYNIKRKSAQKCRAPV